MDDFAKDLPVTAAAPILHDNDGDDSTSYEDCQYILEGSETGRDPADDDCGNHDTGITTTLNEDDDENDSRDASVPREASTSVDKINSYRRKPHHPQQAGDVGHRKVEQQSTMKNGHETTSLDQSSNQNFTETVDRRGPNRSVSFEGDLPGNATEEREKKTSNAMQNRSPRRRLSDNFKSSRLHRGIGDGGESHDENISNESSGSSENSTNSNSESDSDSGTSESEISLPLDQPISKSLRGSNTEEGRGDPKRSFHPSSRGNLPRQASGRRAMAMQALKVAAQSVKSNITENETYNFKSIVRQTRKVDMETGVKSTREFTAQRIVDPEFWTPMNPQERRKKVLLRRTKENLNPEVIMNTSRHRQMNISSRGFTNGDNNKKESPLDDEIGPQYRLRSMIEKVRTVIS